MDNDTSNAAKRNSDIFKFAIDVEIREFDRSSINHGVRLSRLFF